MIARLRWVKRDEKWARRRCEAADRFKNLARLLIWQPAGLPALQQDRDELAALRAEAEFVGARLNRSHCVHCFAQFQSANECPWICPECDFWGHRGFSDCWICLENIRLHGFAKETGLPRALELWREYREAKR